MKKEVKQYLEACEKLKDAFLADLYPGEPEMYEDWFWVGDKVGEALCWDDRFVNMNHMADYFLYDFTPDEFFDWYDKCYNAINVVNMKNYKKLKK